MNAAMVWCTAVIALLAPGHLAAGAEGRPNVLLVMTDDQGYGDFSIHGNPHLKTPNVDRLGETGVRFDRFYVNSFCSPTRAALLTGRWPLRTGVFGVTHNKEAMRPSEVTLGEAFKSAGYRTGCFGKWHNGEQYPYTPTGQGFDEFLGFTNGHWNNYFDATLRWGTKWEPTKGYITDVITDEAMRFIKESKGGPFFCYVAFNAPHSPFQVPDRNFDKFKAQGFEDNVAAFYGMCEKVDENLGRLLGLLEEQKLAESTIVLFLTDNGGTAGVKLYNAGMRGGKTSVHEGGTRVPLFMRWPAAKWQARVVEPITAHIDIYPTLMDLCGIKPPEGPKVDGVSLRALLEGNGSNWPERVLFTHNPIDETNKYPGAVRTQRYRLVREIRGKAGGSGAVAKDQNAKAWQLYDMKLDPGQEKDIAAEHPEVVSELAALYDGWFADISSEGLKRPPIPVGYQEQEPVEIHAPQGYYDAPLTFACGPGWANDWLTNWTEATAKVWFEIDVVKAGEYVVELDYGCPEAEAGSVVRLRAGEEWIQGEVPAAEVKEIPLRHRDAEGHAKYRDREWGTWEVGSLKLAEGQQKVVVEVVKMRGKEVMELKAVRLKRKGG